MFKTITLFVAELAHKLALDDLILSLTNNAEAVLQAALPDDKDYSYLVLRDPRGAELVKITNIGGTLILTRAQDNTAARVFPCGTSVTFECVPPVIKEMICSTDCFDACDIDPITYTGCLLPKAVVGTPWEGSVIFAGSGPMLLGVRNAPDWMEVAQANNSIVLRGTPTTAGTVTIVTAGANCSGKHIDAIDLTFEVGA